MTIKLSAAPGDVQSRLQALLPQAIIPALDQALLKTELWLSELSAERLRKGEPDVHAKDSQALHAASEQIRRKCQEKLKAAIDALPRFEPAGKKKSVLSLIDDDQMEMQLAGERLVEKLSYLHRKGLEAADQRLTKVMGLGPFGLSLPFSPYTLSDAVRFGLADLDVADEYKALVMRHFEALVDPVLSDFLRDLNAGFVAAGVLPELVVQDEEERKRRETMRPSRDARPPEQAPAEAAPAAPAVAPAKSAPAANTVEPADRSLFSSLMSLLQGLRGSQGQAPAPTRPLASSETLSVLDLMKDAAPGAVLSAISQPGGSIAETIKREMNANAAKLGISGPGVGLGPSDEMAVEMTGHLFEVMLKDRPYAASVAPVLASMVMPFIKAAVMDPELFLQRHHPARQLLNTVSEACEDNLGESPQDRALLDQVQTAVGKINSEFDGSSETFVRVEQELSGQMESYRKRAALTEKRAGETQNGQERLELARREAAKALQSVVSDRAMPTELQEYLVGHWKHHMSITALRNSTDSAPWQSAFGNARGWIDLLDNASLGEPLPSSRVEVLREPTRQILATSGVQDDSANRLFDGLVRALQQWSEADPSDAPVEVAAARPASAVAPPRFDAFPESVHGSASSAAPAPGLDSPSAQVMPVPVAPPRPEPVAVAPLDPDDIKFVQSLEVGTWVELPNANGVLQPAKVSWISGISGLVMFVNRRGARVMALSPPEVIDYRNRGQLVLFEREAPVDQAMSQLLEKLRTKLEAQSTVGAMN